jgi:hypothetical protein
VAECFPLKVVWSRPNLAEFEQFEPYHLDLGEDAEMYRLVGRTTQPSWGDIAD